MLLAAADQSPAEMLLRAFGGALVTVWIVPVALGALAIAAIVIGIAKRVWRHRRFVSSGMADIDQFGGETFEQYLQVLFTKLGYRVERTKFRGDYGGDLVLRKDGVRTVVQAKRWAKSVGVKAVQEAVAAKGYYDCSEAMVVTNSTFTRQAAHLARKNGVVLWDRDVLMSKLSAFRVKKQTASMQDEPDQPTSAAATDRTDVLPTVETCKECAKVLTPGERAYCERNARRFEGRMLCFRHQRIRASTANVD
jgi:restriction system protein